VDGAEDAIQTCLVARVVFQLDHRPVEHIEILRALNQKFIDDLIHKSSDSLETGCGRVRLESNHLKVAQAFASGGRCTGIRQGLQDLLTQRLLLEWFGHVAHHAESIRSGYVLAGGLGRQHYDRDPRAGGHFAELGEHFESVHPRHSDIEKNKVRRLALRRGESLDSISRFGDLEVASGKGAPDQHADHPAIVNSEY
jgi:hypothetical protein